MYKHECEWCGHTVIGRRKYCSSICKEAQRFVYEQKAVRARGLIVYTKQEWDEMSRDNLIALSERPDAIKIDHTPYV